MLKFVLSLFLIILTSFYFFPFEFTFCPGINTKMAMAGIGLVLVIFQMALNRKVKIKKDFFYVSLLAVLVSFVGFVSVAINETPDYTYASYIISMLVWCSAAYTLTFCIRKNHGYISVELLCNYLIAVCVIQCILAFAMTQFPSLKTFVDSFLAGEGFMGKSKNRLYGVGASLDVAGSRFAVILVMIIYLSQKVISTVHKKYIGLYLIAFIIIAVFGNMISRTTTVGLIVSMIYLFLCTVRVNAVSSKLLFHVGIAIFVAVLIVVYLYNSNVFFHEHLRFAFEGFFSLVEKGSWDVHSNEILKDMYVFPDNFRTWIIGDGYFDNPKQTDLYYIGTEWKGFYHDTDVGYLRFIFYFGLLGLGAFTVFMCKAGVICMNRFQSYRGLFFMILLLNFIIWLKVSTDIFLVFALFLCISKEENDAYEERMLQEAENGALPVAEE